MEVNMKAKVTIKELDEAPKWLRDSGIGVEIHTVEITMAETRQSPTHGQFSSNKAGVMLGATVTVDATKEDSKDTMEKIVNALIAEAGHNLQRIMGSMS